jgi:hypothetical protein
MQLFPVISIKFRIKTIYRGLLLLKGTLIFLPGQKTTFIKIKDKQKALEFSRALKNLIGVRGLPVLFGLIGFYWF